MTNRAVPPIILGSVRRENVNHGTRASRAVSLPAEIAIVWMLYLLDGVAILITYSRIPAHELYHVSHGGLAGGASRVVVFSNFSMALAAIAVAGSLYECLPHVIERATAVVAVLLCAAVVWPGVVDQADLDAKAVNAVAAVGVVLVLALSIRVARRGLSRTPWHRGDGARAFLAAAAVLVALPWIAAELGFFLDGVPVLAHVFETGEHVADVRGLPPFPPAVHHGHHHGMDGLLLVLTALLLSRIARPLRRRKLRAAVTAYLALMLCYGIGNIANDFWLEQVVKRRWTTWEIPNVLEPRATVAWAIIVACAASLWAVEMFRGGAVSSSP